VLYAPGPKLLGAIDLGAVTPAEHADVEQMKFSSGDILLEWQSYDGAGFCIKKWSGRLHWSGEKVDLSNLAETATQPKTGC
jgi:hypothetical protein